MDFGDMLQQDRRLCVLRFLHESPKYTASLPLIALVLERDGHFVAQSAVLAEVAWLEGAGLVRSEMIDKLMLVTLTQTGAEVATGRMVMPGVRRPDPV